MLLAMEVVVHKCTKLKISLSAIRGLQGPCIPPLLPFSRAPYNSHSKAQIMSGSREKMHILFLSACWFTHLADVDTRYKMRASSSSWDMPRMHFRVICPAFEKKSFYLIDHNFPWIFPTMLQRRRRFKKARLLSVWQSRYARAFTQ